MNDPTESTRRDIVHDINSNPGNREQLEKQYGEVYAILKMDELFEITGFMAPFVAVRRRADDVKGTMMFQDNPRYYFNFKEV